MKQPTDPPLRGSPTQIRGRSSRTSGCTCTAQPPQLRLAGDRTAMAGPPGQLDVLLFVGAVEFPGHRGTYVLGGDGLQVLDGGVGTELAAHVQAVITFFLGELNQVLAESGIAQHVERRASPATCVNGGGGGQLGEASRNGSTSAMTLPPLA